MDSSSSPNLQLLRLNNDNKKTREWSAIPDELLAKIASKLGVVELVNFQSVCKDWNSASHTASAELQSSQLNKPSLLIYGENSDQELLLVGKSGDVNRYKINIPELSEERVTCIASNNGWLLLLKLDYNVYLFHPFSRAKIDLPQLPNLEFSNCVAAISSPDPSSQDCVVSLICQREESLSDLVLYVLRRGESAWARHQYLCPNRSLKKLVCCSYYDEKFYFLDAADKIVTFSAKNIQWKQYQIVSYTRDPEVKSMPFMHRKHYLMEHGRKKRLGLEDVSIKTCGTAYAGKISEKIISNESIGAPRGSETRKLVGIWVHPRFFDVPRNFNW